MKAPFDRLLLAATMCAFLLACSPSGDAGSKDASRARKAEWPVPLPPGSENASDVADNASADNAADNAAQGNAQEAASGGGSGGGASDAPAAAGGDAAAGPGTSKPSETAKGRAPARSPTYRAVGTEPFWSVTVADDSLILEMPDMLPRRFGVTVTTKGGTIRFQGDGIVMTATPGTCSDGMSDDAWSDRVQVALADRILKGCGGMRWRGAQP